MPDKDTKVVKDSGKKDKEDKKKVTVSKKDTKSKSTKTSKDDEEKDTRNKNTLRAGLELNVSMFKKWIKKHYSLTNAQEEKESGKPTKFQGLQYVLAALTQVLAVTLLGEVSDQLKKSKEGLYDVQYKTLESVVATKKHLKNPFGYALDQFNDSTHYLDNLPVASTEFVKFVEKFCFHGNSSVSLNKETLNLLAFLINHANALVCDAALVMTKGVGKNTVSSKLGFIAVKLLFKDKLLKEFENKITTVLRSVAGDGKKEKDDEKDDEKETKGKKDKKESKDSKDSKDSKKAKKEESDNESEAESDAESDADSDAGSDEEDDDE